MNKNILSVSILITGILVVSAITNRAYALEVSYPVVELGNCADQASCKAYCNKPANIDACLSFAEKNNLMSKDEIKAARNFKKTGMTGPGGCKGKDECSTYCNGPDHMDECITFAEKNGMMSGSQLEEAKKVKSALAKGIKPPACGGKEACDTYCSSPEHIEECVRFGEDAGMISKEDAEKIRQNGGKGKGQGQGGKGGDRQGPGGGKQGPEGQGQSQGDGKQRPPKGKGRGGQKNGGPGGQQQGRGPGGQQGPGGQNPGDGSGGL